MNWKVLHDEIVNDPLTKGYTSMSEQEIVESLNTENREIEVAVPSNRVLEWSASNGRLAKISDAILDDATYDQSVRSVAEAGKLLITRESTSYRKLSHGTLFDVLVTAGILIQSDKDALDILGTETKSRASELGLLEITESDVYCVMEEDYGC